MGDEKGGKERKGGKEGERSLQLLGRYEHFTVS